MVDCLKEGRKEARKEAQEGKVERQIRIRGEKERKITKSGTQCAVDGAH